MVLNKYLKNIGLKGRQVISLPVAPTCLGPVLCCPTPIGADKSFNISKENTELKVILY